MEKSIYEKIGNRINADNVIPIFSTYTTKSGCIFVAQGNAYAIENIGDMQTNCKPYSDYVDLYVILTDTKAQRVYFSHNIQTDESTPIENLELPFLGITIPLTTPNSDHDIRTAAAFDCINTFMEQNQVAESPIDLYITDLSQAMLLPKSSDTADNLTAQEIISEIDNNAQSAMLFVLTEVAKLTNSRESLAKGIISIYAAISDVAGRNRLKYDIYTATSGQPPQGRFEDLPPIWKIKACGISSEYLADIDKHGLNGTKQARLEKLSAEMHNAARNSDFAKLQNFASELDGIRFADGSANVLAQLNAPRQTIEQAIAEHHDDLETQYTLHDFSYYVDLGEKGIRTMSERLLSFSACGVSVVVAAAKHGKTLFLLDTAVKFAISPTDNHILFFSIEEDAAQIATKIYRTQAPNTDNLFNGDNGILNGLRRLIRNAVETGESDEKIQDLRRNYDKVTEYLHFARIGDDIDQAVASIKTAISKYRSEGKNVSVVFVDYLQLLRYIKNSYSRTDELSSVCSKLNDLSKSEQIAIITAAQFNREAKRGSKLDDWGVAMIAESQSIENIATDVYMLLNPEMIKLNENDDGKRATILRNCSNEGSIMYIENLMSREHRSGGVCVLQCDYSWGILGSELKSNNSNIAVGF